MGVISSEQISVIFDALFGILHVLVMLNSCIYSCVSYKHAAVNISEMLRMNFKDCS